MFQITDTLPLSRFQILLQSLQLSQKRRLKQLYQLPREKGAEPQRHRHHLSNVQPHPLVTKEVCLTEQATPMTLFVSIAGCVKTLRKNPVTTQKLNWSRITSKEGTVEVREGGRERKDSHQIIYRWFYRRSLLAC